VAVQRSAIVQSVCALQNSGRNSSFSTRTGLTGLSCRYKHSTSDFKTKEILRAMGTGSLSRGKKLQGRDVDHQSISISEVKEGVELYIYSSLPSWSVTA